MTIFLAVFATSRQALPPRDTICNSETFCHFETRFTQLRDILPPRDMTFCHRETWHVSIWQPPLNDVSNKSRRELTLDQAKNAVSGAINSINIDNIVKDAVNNKNQ